MVSQILPYDEVIDRYRITVLEQPGDLVLKDGELAVTKSGDLMVNSPGYSALYRLVQWWRHSLPMLTVLFNQFCESRARKRPLEAEAERALGKWTPGQPLVRDFSAYHEAIEIQEANELTEEVSAGSLLLALSRMVQSFRDDLSLDPRDALWRQSGPLHNGVSVGEAVVAAANNFRHAEEWARARTPTAQQGTSHGALVAMTQIDATTARGVFWPRVLELLAGEDLDQLGRAVFGFANDVVQRLESKG